MQYKMKKIWLLIDNGKILDKVFTYSAEDAELLFKRDRDWIFSDTAFVISEDCWLNELELNSLLNITVAIGEVNALHRC
jgi:hypothetical protein